MKILVVDTSRGLEAIYLDLNKKKKEKLRVYDEKLSSVFHKKLNRLLEENEVSWQELDQFFYNLGPGSYTGLKVAHSLAGNLEQEGVSIFGYYSYQLAEALGVKEGLWIENAFKGEYFLYQWGAKYSKKLVNILDYEWDESQNYYSCSLEKEKKIIHDIKESFFEKTEQFLDFWRLESPQNRDIYYYRLIEEEFKRK